jgi:hypothetical protein
MAGACGEDTRNFFWCGDGDPDRLTSIRGGISISRSQVASALGNTLDPSKLNLVRPHPYRVVFLNSCFSAMGDDAWPTAFGIFKVITRDELVASPQAAQAFAGWNNKATGPLDDVGWQNYSTTMGVLWGQWMLGEDLETCLNRASKTKPFDDLPIELEYPLDCTWSSSHARLVFSGYKFITRTGYR